MCSDIPPKTTRRSAISKANLALALASTCFLAVPALANTRPIEVDNITTGSIAGQAMIWTVDPSLVLMLLGLFCIGLVVAGFTFLRSSLRDALEIDQKNQTNA